MTKPTYIFESAQLLINEHEEKALDEAQRRVESFRTAGDNEAMVIWQNISNAIYILQRFGQEKKTIQ